MGTDDGSALKSRIRFLQNQVTNLGYKYDVSTDSLSLIEALVADLLQTTDSLKHYKELSQGCIQVKKFLHQLFHQFHAIKHGSNVLIVVFFRLVKSWKLSWMPTKKTTLV